MLGFIFLRLSCLLIVYTHPLLSHAHDTLDQNQSIKDGQSLVSSGDIFELGFFSPGNSTFRYVGIWYKNVSTQTVVWVANRQAPITGFNGSLTIKSDGNMVVLNGSGNAVWSTNSSTESKNFTAQLMDSGNFVLQESDGTVLWESFDYPTDTFVPGMKILRDSKKGMNQNQILTSWRSPNDPSIGEYSLGLDHRGSAQFFIWQGTAPRWRSGQWNGETFIGTMIRPLYMYGFRLTNDVSDGIMYFTFTPFNTSLLRFVLQENGVEKTSMLVEGNQWESVWTQPLNECDIYGKCGDNAVCVYKNAATCNCLRGFDPKSKDEWGRGNWSGGCVRRTPLQCQSNASSSVGGEADGFFAIQGVKVPDLSDWASTVESEAGCQYACLNNCSCKAYAFPSGIGCLIWSHDLIDMYQFAQGGSVLNLKLAASELGSNHKTWKIIVAILCALGVASLIICLFFWWKYNARIKNWWKKGGKGESLSNTDFLSGPNVDGDEGRSSELPFYRFDQLATATNKFSDSKKLGQGGFGDVYKGILPGGQEVAVKRLSATSGQGMEEFKNEVILIAKLQHRNLVRLVGCCIQGEEKILVYEYMPNKSLDAFLFEKTKQALLDWGIRFNIIEGVARGLLYLHRDSRLRIIHRDLKASNILLDEDMNPKISDFGMARIFGGDQNQANTNRVVGTYGYMSPEYAMEGLFSVKSDVYSFGVLVLEIVSGRRNKILQSSLNIIGEAWRLWSEDRATELIDQSIRSSNSTHQMVRCIHIALLCVQDHATDRPDMASVVLMLGSENANLPTPNEPKFLLLGSANKKENVVNESESVSVNNVAITVVEGR